MPPEFQGNAKLDVLDSTPDWGAYINNVAQEGAPNVRVVIYDDPGSAGND